MADRPRKQASPERWQNALHRAIKESVKVYQSELTGEWFATSGSTNLKLYHIEVFPRTEPPTLTCTCEAAEHNDPVCKHRARWYFENGWLEFDYNYAQEVGSADLLSS